MPSLARDRIGRWARRLARGLAATLVVCGLAVAGGYAWLLTGLPQTDGQLALPGLAGAVRVYRDRDGVPHIFADSTDDAYEALGFVHAQDRLFQMDWQRRLGQGRLAELIGSRGLAADRILRTLGLYRLAEQTAAELPAEVRRALEAYSRGVNAYLTQHQGALPPEYYALWAEPEPWTPADSLVWGRVMAMLLDRDGRGQAVRARLRERLTPEQYADLTAPDGPTPITLGATQTGALPPPERPAAPLPGGALVDRLLKAAADALPEPELASNAWVLDGRHTRSGKPLLANDPHLGFQAPALWYLARIVTPALTVSGATLPGIPFHLLGQNGHIAWGFTTTGASTQDLVLERLAQGQQDRYDTPDGPRPFTVRHERIEVRFGAPVDLKIRTSVHGPIISDLDAGPDDPVTALAGGRFAVALQATGLRPDDSSATALYRLNRATDWASFRAAVAGWDAPVQNMMMASRDGDIGLIAPGKVPIRQSGDGTLPVAGWTGEADWAGFIPADQAPQGLDPPAGLLVNTNNQLVGPDYPYLIARRWDVPYRAERALAVLAGSTGRTAADEAALQADPVSLMAAELLPVLLATPDPGHRRSPRAEAARQRLAAWDHRMDRNRPEPLIFAAWLRALYQGLYGAALGPDFREAPGLTPRLVLRALQGGTPWCQIEPSGAEPAGAQPRPSCTDIVNDALERALSDLARRLGDRPDAWRWGELHQARHDHLLFGRLPLFDRLTSLAIPADGGDDTLERGAMPLLSTANPFADVHGAAYRAVYDLADPDASLYVIATGESGNPLSPHYGDFVRRWRDGATRRLAGQPDQLAAAGAALLTLTPAP